MKTKSLNSRLVFIILFLLFAELTKATTYYVSNNGSDSNTGISPSEAYEHIQFGIAFLQPSDTLLVLNGFYEGFKISCGGEVGNPIVIMANGDSVIINEPSSLSEESGILLASSSGCEITGIEINGFILQGLPRHGIRAVGVHHCTIINNTATDNVFDGIQLGVTSDVVVERNTCFNNRVGINFGDENFNPIIKNNQSFNNDLSGIQTDGDGFIIFEAVIDGNEVFGNNSGAGINIHNISNSLIINNLSYNNSCLLYTSPSPRDRTRSRMPSSA